MGGPIFNEAVEGRDIGTTGSGVRGWSDRIYGYGVQGISESTYGVGVHGSHGSWVGVYGLSDSGRGVEGYSNSGTGVAGHSNSNIGTGVRGTAPYGGTGVYGGSSSGRGVYGASNSSTGVFGHSISGTGVWGDSTSSPGVIGTPPSGTGVFGHSISGPGVAGYSESESWGGVYGYSEKGIGVRGDVRSGTGVYGISSSGFGVYGKSLATVGGYGVVGEAPSGYGVYGYSESENWGGVYGNNGSSGRGIGVRGEARNGYGVYGQGGTGAAFLEGNVHVTGTINKSAVRFKIDHPLDPANKYLYHSSIESPDMKNVYDGVVVLDANGEAEIELPDWFDALNKDFRYQLTPIGAPGPNLYIAKEISDGVTNDSNKNNRFKIAGGNPSMKVSWQVTGIRKDPWANANRIQVEEDKPANERGYYLHPDLYGQPEEGGISHLLFPKEEKWQEPIINENKPTL